MRQYSVQLTAAPAGQLAVLKHWVAFTRAHSQALYRGDFRVQGLSSDAPVLVGESAEERIVGAYKPGFVADCGAPDRRVFVLNCTGTPRVAVRFAAAAKGVVYVATWIFPPGLPKSRSRAADSSRLAGKRRALALPPRMAISATANASKIPYSH